jgi:hypothetical protein
VDLLDLTALAQELPHAAADVVEPVVVLGVEVEHHDPALDHLPRRRFTQGHPLRGPLVRCGHGRCDDLDNIVVMVPDPLTESDGDAMLSLTVDAATVRVIGWLQDAGIRSILLKGGVLRSWLYGDGETRTYGDIDILVSPDQIDTAAALMRARGWTDSQYPSETGHADHLSPPAGQLPIPLDLHRSFHYLTVPPERVWELLSARAVPTRLAGHGIETLDEPGLAVIVTLHHVRHGAGTKHTEDLERAVAREPLEVWREAADLAGQLGAMAAFVAGLRDVRGGVALADALGLPEATDPALHLALVSPPPTSVALLQLRQAGADPAALLRVLRSELVPPPLRMREHYPLARRGPAGLLGAYLVRPFQLAPRLRAGWRAATASQAEASEISCSSTVEAKVGRRPLGRFRLASEIVMTYVRVRRAALRTDIRTVLRELRDAPLERVPATSAAEADAAHLARGTVRVLHHMPGDTRCLNRSLVLSALLARRGVASRVVIAVSGPANDFGAHAWVEAEGQALLAPGAPGDARLVEL